LNFLFQVHLPLPHTKIVEKEYFLFLTRNFDSLNAEEAGELISVKSEFPYSQLIHNLAARATRDNALHNSEQELQLSAVYSTDRSVLKSIMAAPSRKRPGMIPQQKSAADSIAAPKIPIITESSDVGLTGDGLRAEIAQDLHRLKKLKQEFETRFRKVELSNTASKQEEKKNKTFSGDHGTLFGGVD
jgi:hypothetical protein